MSIYELLEQQEGALKDKNIPQARRLLQEIRAEIEKREAWNWLRANEPESYAQLLGKLEQAGESLSPSGRAEVRQLPEVFE